MREILFRGKAANRIEGRAYRTNYKNGDWVEGLLTWPMNYKGFAEMTNTNGVSGIEVDPETVGQYTGKTDVSGKKIFEGDIVTYNDCYNYPVKGIVRYCAPEFLVEVPGRFAHHHRMIDSEDIRDAQVCFTAKYKYKIIGNIHDSPELEVSK